MQLIKVIFTLLCCCKGQQKTHLFLERKKQWETDGKKAQTDTYRQRERQRQRDTEGDRDRERQRQRDTEGDRDRETQRYHKYILK